MEIERLMHDLPGSQWRRAVRRELLTWFRQNARDLPWRTTRDAYPVWISEIMLQQTQVVTVVPYFQRFVQRFPNVAALAAAEEEDVLRLWEGLGYYRRARQLHAAAREVVEQHGGQFPQDMDDVCALPGIGRYTAGAILSIAFDARQPILEANTRRVLSRLLAYREDPTRSAAQRLLWEFAEALLPVRGAGTFNQALMELGSEVCTPRAPGCDICPLIALCPTYEQGLQRMIPVPKKKTRYAKIHEAAIVIQRGDKLLLRRRAPGERWAGLWDFPRFAITARRGSALRKEITSTVAQLTGMDVELGPRLATIKHAVTRFRITLLCHRASYQAGRPRKSHGTLRWVRPAELEGYPLSVTGRKISRLLADQHANGNGR